MTMKLAQVDAFTDRPFGGNPAAVCLLNEPVSDQWMQNVAKEMNLSETAFLLKESASFNLRWFTPETEVELCGHATLAAAHMLWEWNLVQLNDDIEFSTLSGRIYARRSDKWIEMDFPAEPPKESTYPKVLLEALGVKVAQVARNRFDYLVILESEEAVKEVRPNFGLLMEVDTRGVIVTAKSDSTDADFVSRFFAPRVAVDEDPVTGSAHCCLAPYWAKRLDKDELVGYQYSERGGTVRTRIADDRVFLSGKALTIFLGDLSSAVCPPSKILK